MFLKPWCEKLKVKIFFKKKPYFNLFKTSLTSISNIKKHPEI